jgi:SAM-dependent methyltransferase
MTGTPARHTVTGMTTTQPIGLADMKAATRRTWAAGDFPAVAQRELWTVGERLVRRVGIGRGEDVLDVACGTGNAAIRAARAGGRVVGVDLTPELFDAGRRLADEAGVTVEWVEGDAEELPFPDASFDVVLSTFGVMFAPRHRVAAAELARVLRPGGRLGVCSWTPEGSQGTCFRRLAGYAPPAPDFAQPPLLWGSEAHVRDLFAGTGVHVEFDREVAAAPRYATGYEAVDFGAANFGPLIMLRARLEATGAWPAFRDELATLYEDSGAPEYLVVTGRKE